MTTMASSLEDASRPSEDIDRLALRISLADIDEQFEKVVQKSLVFILRYLAKYEDHRKKLMELLGDVTRRLKFRPNIQVPVHELFLTYNDPSDSVFLINFSHMYIRLGYPRLPFPLQVKLLPVLYASLSEDKPVCQRDALLHLTLPFIGDVTSDMVQRDLGLSELPLQRRFITDFYSLVLLMPYRLIRFDGNDAAIPDGFNSYDLSRVVHDRFSTINSAEDLEKTIMRRGSNPIKLSLILLLIPVLLKADPLNNLKLEKFDQQKETYDCSSYLRQENYDRSLETNVNEIVKWECPEYYRMEIVSVNFVETNCDILFTYYPRKEEVMKDRRCARAVDMILTDIIVMTWGYAWGCREAVFLAPITPYMDFMVVLKDTENFGLAITLEERCEIPTLQINKTLEFVCDITKYAGYYWHLGRGGACKEPTLNRINDTVMSVAEQSPIKCQLLIFLLIGVVKNKSEIVIKEGGEVAYAFNKLQNWCPTLKEAQFPLVRKDLHLLFYLMLKIIILGPSEKRDFLLITKILRAHAEYWQAFFGESTDFFHGSKWLFVTQNKRYGDVKNRNDNEFIHLSFPAKSPTTLVACTTLFHETGLPHQGNRITAGICYVGVNGGEVSTISVTFVKAQHDQIINYHCARMESSENSFKPDDGENFCTIEGSGDGDIICKCLNTRYISLIHYGTGEDDIEHTPKNSAETPIMMILHTTLCTLLFAGSSFMMLIQVWKPARRLYVRTQRTKFALCFIQLTMHVLFLSGAKLLLQWITIVHDDHDVCMYLGPFQYAIFTIFEIMNTLKAMELLTVRRSHRPFSIVMRTILFAYACGAIAGIVTFVVSSYQYLRICCYSRIMRYTMCLTYAIINALGLIITIWYVILKRTHNWGESLGDFLICLYDLVMWSIHIPANRPKLILDPAHRRIIYMNLWQGLLLFVYHCFLKENSVAFFTSICSKLCSKKEFVRRISRFKERESSVGFIFPLPFRKSGRMSASSGRRFETLESFTSLEFDQQTEDRCDSISSYMSGKFSFPRPSYSSIRKLRVSSYHDKRNAGRSTIALRALKDSSIHGEKKPPLLPVLKYPKTDES
ncbi:unnamed protein product [Calicophoron daubneyi]|uniref:Proteasome component Ecm29 N-terminal domain-containing protein n=1 Tax=Calicophoron daubneyi TaxID=300641 RepID=A0AAV2TC64_CALDB